MNGCACACFKEYGLPAANAEIATFGTQRVLVVERFDRKRSSDGSQLFRLVQEDFCQATGTSPLLKYENDGGPGLKQMFTLLQQSRESAADMHTLMASQLLFWMLRAPDGHAKNFSIQLLAGAGRFKLTPMYDVMSGIPLSVPVPTSGQSANSKWRWHSWAAIAIIWRTTSSGGTSTALQKRSATAQSRCCRISLPARPQL